MLIWKADANRDWKIQFGEVALIEYFSASDAYEPNTIRYYEAKPVTAAEIADAAEQIADENGVPTNNALYTDANIDAFKLCSYVKYAVLARMWRLAHSTEATPTRLPARRLTTCSGSPVRAAPKLITAPSRCVRPRPCRWSNAETR